MGILLKISLKGSNWMMCSRVSSRGSMILYMVRESRRGKSLSKIVMQNVKKRRRMIIKHQSSLIAGQNGKIIMSNMTSQSFKILKKTMMKTKILKLTKTPKHS
jgi:hypothetical protein